jgi:hypothetical protein
LLGAWGEVLALIIRLAEQRAKRTG